MKSDPTRAAELNALALRYQQGDVRAGDTLIRELTPWIYSRVKRWAKHLRQDEAITEDLAQEGALGILRAASKWRPDGGANILTYATLWIDVFVRNYAVRRVPMVRLTAAEQHDVQSRNRGGHPAALLRLQPLTSLDEPLREGVRPRVEFLCDDTAPDAEALLTDARDASELKARVARAMLGFKPRDREVIRRRFLVDDPETLDAIGASFGVSRERIRQIEKAAVERLRRVLADLAA